MHGALRGFVYVLYQAGETMVYLFVTLLILLCLLGMGLVLALF